MGEEENYPQTWDKTLEKFLETPVDKVSDIKDFSFGWTTQTLHNYGNAQTFVAAINGDRPKKIFVPPPKKGIMATKEDIIRKMILKPLSPRKTDIIPGSRKVVKQRDKYAVESIIQQRNRRHVLSSLQPLPDFYQPEETQRSSTSASSTVRQFTIPTRNRELRFF